MNFSANTSSLFIQMGHFSAPAPSSRRTRMSDRGNSKLTAKRLKEVLSYDPETGVFCWITSTGRCSKGKLAGWKNSRGYINIKVDGRQYKAHRLAWLYINGEFPSEELDHKNLNKSDNRFSNLRLANRSQNSANRPAFKHTRSGYKGAQYFPRNKKKPWRSMITTGNGKRKFLGSFETPEDAASAYLTEARRLHGEFAYKDLS